METETERLSHLLHSPNAMSVLLETSLGDIVVSQINNRNNENVLE